MICIECKHLQGAVVPPRPYKYHLVEQASPTYRIVLAQDQIGRVQNLSVVFSRHMVDIALF